VEIFLAGIIQGSIAEERIHRQDYRDRLKRTLRQALPAAELFCPIENHPDSLGYSFDKGRDVFRFLIDKAVACDVLLAFIPEASMGTAIEMWEAYNSGRLVIAISPLKKNWAVKFLSHHIFSTLDEFEEFVVSGGLRELIDKHYGPEGSVKCEEDGEGRKEEEPHAETRSRGAAEEREGREENDE